jgi:hypothetical protein
VTRGLGLSAGIIRLVAARDSRRIKAGAGAFLESRTSAVTPCSCMRIVAERYPMREPEHRGPGDRRFPPKILGINL